MSNNGVTHNTEALLRVARNERIVTAASLSRIFQHIADGESYAFLSAFRPDLSTTQNLKRQKDLQSQIRGLGYGFIKLKGQWEDTENRDDEGNFLIYREDSAFIIGIPLDDAVALASKFNQDAVLWGKKGEDGALYDSSGTLFLSLGHPTLLKIEKLFSQFKNYRFKFASLEYSPQGYVSGLVWLSELKAGLVNKLGEPTVDNLLLTDRIVSRYKC